MKSPIQRIEFNASNKEHRDALFTFLDKGRWVKHFELKTPYIELPYQLYVETLQYYRGVSEA